MYADPEADTPCEVAVASTMAQPTAVPVKTPRWSTVPAGPRADQLTPMPWITFPEASMTFTERPTEPPVFTAVSGGVTSTLDGAGFSTSVTVTRADVDCVAPPKTADTVTSPEPGAVAVNRP